MACLAHKIPCGALRDHPPPDEADSALPDSKKTSMTTSTSQVHSCPLTTLVSQNCLFRHKSRNLLTSMLALFCPLPAQSLQFLSKHVLTEAQSLTKTLLTTTGTSADSELSDDVLQFLVSCLPRLAQFSRDLSHSDVRGKNILLGLASWGKEMKGDIIDGVPFRAMVWCWRMMIDWGGAGVCYRWIIQDYLVDL